MSVTVALQVVCELGSITLAQFTIVVLDRAAPTVKVAEAVAGGAPLVWVATTA